MTGVIASRRGVRLDAAAARRLPMAMHRRRDGLR
jgi:hypothetical protein